MATSKPVDTGTGKLVLTDNYPPVSYTHLDVYKRQKFIYYKFFIFIIITFAKKM